MSEFFSTVEAPQDLQKTSSEVENFVAQQLSAKRRLVLVTVNFLLCTRKIISGTFKFVLWRCIGEANT